MSICIVSHRPSLISFDYQYPLTHLSTGMTKVSRKALIDKHTLPDTLSATIPEPSPSPTGGNTTTGGDTKGGKKALPWNVLPTFPMSPPKKWSREYFKNNIVSASDIEAAMSGKGETFATTSTTGDLSLLCCFIIITTLKPPPSLPHHYHHHHSY